MPPALLETIISPRFIHLSKVEVKAPSSLLETPAIPPLLSEVEIFAKFIQLLKLQPLNCPTIPPMYEYP